ncbi:hypothetical protein GIS00_14240 [Nakamurella sp. YIM 132087]|uniref:receptor protein-tyrosine kinase n=2 Tax=Nakamurella alba TaxID=2665158 RepID=A0A7K1FP44_9ACTN|nr:hypothetical protein [Nakamurella alba]
MRCSGDVCSWTYEYTGKIETFVVPEGVGEIRIEVYGAAGDRSDLFPRVLPGAGGLTTGVLAVQTYDEYTVLIGQRGRKAGAFGGGGGVSARGFNGGGGGGSFVGAEDGTLLLAAGGGGGGGSDGKQYGVGDIPDVGGDGAGAGSTGINGSGNHFQGDDPPTGGTPTGPGAAGVCLYHNGSPGQGPATGTTPGAGGAGSDHLFEAGAGGGGGYYGGGGGGEAQSGAGGSGFAAAAVTQVRGETGVRRGDGLVVISASRSPFGAAPAPEGSGHGLAWTGAPIGALLAIGAGLLAAGSAMVGAARRRPSVS